MDVIVVVSLVIKTEYTPRGIAGLVNIFNIKSFTNDWRVKKKY